MLQKLNLSENKIQLKKKLKLPEFLVKLDLSDNKIDTIFL